MQIHYCTANDNTVLFPIDFLYSFQTERNNKHDIDIEYVQWCYLFSYLNLYIYQKMFSHHLECWLLSKTSCIYCYPHVMTYSKMFQQLFKRSWARIKNEAGKVSKIGGIRGLNKISKLSSITHLKYVYLYKKINFEHWMSSKLKQIDTKRYMPKYSNKYNLRYM